MTDKTQELQAQIQALKVRLFDAQEAANVIKADFDHLSQILSHIATVTGVEIGEGGQIQLTDIIARVEQLVAPTVDDEAE
ncbi:chaperone for tail fiber formation [Serratia phage 4S]|nr:chaperone for tail fiber formation [Serratia phage 4S]